MYNKIEGKFGTKLIGKRVICYQTIDSTQKEIWRKIESNDIEEGTIIIADVQTGGIGTHGRKWYTSQKGDIAFSFVMYPNIPVKRLGNLSIEIAEILVTVFKTLYKIKLDIKQPNDIMIGVKKVGGILTETKLQGEIAKVLVIGIGINTNKDFFEDEIKKVATSIKMEYGIQIDNKEILKEFCKEFEDKYLKRLGKEL